MHPAGPIPQARPRGRYRRVTIDRRNTRRSLTIREAENPMLTPLPRSRAGKALSVGAFALAVSLAATVIPAAAQGDGKVPELSSSKFTWVRIRADGRNALYGDGWLDPPAGMRGPIKNHPDHPLQGNQLRGPGIQVTLAIGN